jgi:putative DNA primase/helicase
LFNCQNCVINLQTGEAIPHDPDLLLSKISNVKYDPEVTSVDFDRFIHEIMLNDEEKIRYLQKIFGYCLTGENTQEQCYMCYGSTTRNGKSTLLEVIGYLFGDYAMNIQPETLAQRERNSRNASGDIARLDGCRFLHMSEPPKRMKFDVALLKALIGRDPITARHLHEREFEFTPVFKLMINTNYLPVVTDDTLFSSERVKVITFDRHFKPEEQDRKLKGRLKKDYNLSGIFNWCLEGLKAFQNDGGILIEPDSVKSATEDYRSKSDKIQNFINDCLIYTPGVNSSIKDTYEAFKNWCQDNGFGTENKSNFIEEMKTKGLHANSGTVYGVTKHNVVKDHIIAVDYITR